MKFHPKRPSPAMAVAVLALCVAAGGGTALAASSVLARGSVGPAQLQTSAVTGSKIADGAVGRNKLTPLAQQGITGPAGKDGTDGKDGKDGKDGIGAPTAVTALGTTWVAHNGDTGTSTIDAKGAELGDTGTGDFAGIATDSLNGMTPADLSSISYTESYTQSPDSGTAEPYFKLKLQPGDATTCGDDDVVYNPLTQTPSIGDYSGETTTYNVTAPYSTVGVDNDANPVDGNYPTALHSAKNGAGADVSGEPICLAEIIFDGGSGADGGTATVNDVSFAGAGITPVTYKFGS